MKRFLSEFSLIAGGAMGALWMTYLFGPSLHFMAIYWTVLWFIAIVAQLLYAGD